MCWCSLTPKFSWSLTRTLGNTERTEGKWYPTRNAARADVFDYVERGYNPMRPPFTLPDIPVVLIENLVEIREARDTLALRL